MILRCLFYVCLKVCAYHRHGVRLLVYYVVLEEPLPALVLSGETLEMKLQIQVLFKEVKNPKKFDYKISHYMLFFVFIITFFF